MQRFPPSIRRALIALLLLVGLASAARGVWHALFNPAGSRDLQWDAVSLLVQRQNPYTIALSGEPAPTDVWMADPLEPNQLPSALALLWPLGWLSWPAARILWTVANLGFTLLFLAALFQWRRKPLHWRTFLPLLALLLAATAWRNLVSFGQHTLFSLAFWSCALWLQQRNRPWIAGIALAISLFKYTTVIPLSIYFLYRRAYRPLLTAAVIHLALTFWVSHWLAESPVTLIEQSLNQAGGLTNAGHLDAPALLARLGFPLPAAGGILLSLLALTGMTLFVLGLRRRHHPVADDKLLTFLAMCSTVVVYHRSYDLVVLALALFFLVTGAYDRATARLLTLNMVVLLYLDYIWQRGVLFLAPRLPAVNTVYLENAYLFPAALLLYGTVLYLAGQLWRYEGTVDRRSDSPAILGDPAP